MKILVPTDFSDNADRLLEFAGKLAEANKDTITLLYAFPPIYDFAARAAVTVKEIERSARKKLQELAGKLRQKNILTDYKILQGDASKTITATAEKYNCDLILSGTPKVRGIQKILFGSHEADVIAESRISVLVIPPKADFERAKKITILLESTKRIELFFEKLIDLTKELDLPYNLLPIETSKKHPDHDSIKLLLKELQQQFPRHEFRLNQFPSTVFQKDIENYLKDNTDLILVIHWKHPGFLDYLFNKSRNLKMAYSTPMPLLIIK